MAEGFLPSFHAYPFSSMTMRSDGLTLTTCGCNGTAEYFVPHKFIDFISSGRTLWIKTLLAALIVLGIGLYFKLKTHIGTTGDIMLYTGGVVTLWCLFQMVQLSLTIHTRTSTFYSTNCCNSMKELLEWYRSPNQPQFFQSFQHQPSSMAIQPLAMPSHHITINNTDGQLNDKPNSGMNIRTDDYSQPMIGTPQPVYPPISPASQLIHRQPSSQALIQPASPTQLQPLTNGSSSSSPSHATQNYNTMVVPNSNGAASTPQANPFARSRSTIGLTRMNSTTTKPTSNYATINPGGAAASSANSQPSATVTIRTDKTPSAPGEDTTITTATATDVTAGVTYTFD